MIGKRASSVVNPRFLLDESLVPVVAQALTLVGFEIADVESSLGRSGVKDPEIIEWCKENNAVWIHADDRAKKQHRALLQTSGIRTIWVYRKHGAMSGKEQLRVISFVLPQLIHNWQESPRQRHYRISAANEFAKPGLRSFDI